MKPKSPSQVGLRCGFQMYKYRNAQERLEHLRFVIGRIVTDDYMNSQSNWAEMIAHDLAVYRRYARLLTVATRKGLPIYPMHN